MVLSRAEETGITKTSYARMTINRPSDSEPGTRGRRASEASGVRSTTMTPTTTTITRVCSSGRVDPTRPTPRHATPPTLPVPCWSSSTLCMRRDDASFASCWR
jgi:hypothetical protein